MHLRVKLTLAFRRLGRLIFQPRHFTYHIAGDDPGAWPQILAPSDSPPPHGGPANLFVVRNVAPGSVPQWIQRIEQGDIVVLEGESELAGALGIHARQETRGGPKHRGSARAEAADRVGDRRRHSGIRSAQGRTSVRHRALGRRAARWPPCSEAPARCSGSPSRRAKQGYERFPYLLQALNDLGMKPAVPQPAPVGFLRWLLPLARRSGLFRRPLAQSRHRRAACRRLALLRTDAATTNTCAG